jgi:hypothetical protein
MRAEPASVVQADEGPAAEAAPEIARLLMIFAGLFLDNVRHLEDTVSRVTDLITRDGRPDKELIVTLQSFDRLKQEFEALGAALARYADSHHLPQMPGEAVSQFSRHVIDTIALADLKDRLLDRLHNQAPAQPLNEPKDDEVDIDVVF